MYHYGSNLTAQVVIFEKILFSVARLIKKGVFLRSREQPKKSEFCSPAQLKGVSRKNLTLKKRYFFGFFNDAKYCLYPAQMINYILRFLHVYKKR